MDAARHEGRAQRPGIHVTEPSWVGRGQPAPGIAREMLRHELEGDGGGVPCYWNVDLRRGLCRAGGEEWIGPRTTMKNDRRRQRGTLKGKSKDRSNRPHSRGSVRQIAPSFVWALQPARSGSVVAGKLQCGTDDFSCAREAVESAPVGLQTLPNRKWKRACR